MNDFIEKMAFLIVGVLIVSNILSYLSLRCLEKSSFYKPSFLVSEVSEKNFDYIILGASTGLTTLDTKVIDGLLNKKGINLSIDDTSLSSHYLMLQHFLAEGKSTKTCIIAPSVSSFDSPDIRLSVNDYRFLPFVNRPYVSEYFQSFPDFNARILSQSRFFPMLGVSYYNAEVFYPSILSVHQPTRHNRFDKMGNYTYPIKSKTSDIIINRKSIELKFQNPVLKKIEELCIKADIKLIYYISPLKNDLVVLDSQSDFNILNHSDKLMNTVYFFDEVHVNSLGREVISERFAEDIKLFLNY